MKVSFTWFTKPIIIIFFTILLSVSYQGLSEYNFYRSDLVVAAPAIANNSYSSSPFSLSSTAPSTLLVSNNRYQTTKTFEQYKPRYAVANIDPSNYGDRYSTDVNGKALNNQPIAVLHETVGSASSAINTFRTHHSKDSQQSSYHALITLDGTIIYLVPSDKRAFGAGNSVFRSQSGIETVQTNPNLPPSVNNFAYHISLETPPDGRKKSGNSYHSGYSDRQYKSLAWLLALSSIPDDRITTHREVDLSGHRFDPRSFDFDKFFSILHSFRQPSARAVSAQ
ncbi:MAG: peptidoglycan recognition family protein [Cyanobacteria bacterium P01_G01_bin.19]